MKKKLTINSLALGNLKQRRKQYTILIIGIILAIVFSSGTLFFISCTQSSNEEFQRRSIGDYYGYYFNPPDFVDMEGGVKDGYIENYGYAHILGYAYTDEEKMDRGTPIAYLDENAKDLYYIALKEGKYPENKGEIALEADAALRLGIDAKVGEEISLSVLNANGTDFSNTATEKTYKIVGILTDKRKNLEYYDSLNVPTMAAAFVSDKEEVDAGGKEILALYFNPTQRSLNNAVKVQDGDYYYITTEFEGSFLNKIYEKAYEQNGSYSVPDIMLVSRYYYDSNSTVENSSLLTITLTVVLMLASCIGIINAFSTNLQERRKQIGMLRAVGATKRQIINIFGRETFIIALICAPIGVAISYFGVKLFATIMGDDYIFIPDMAVLFGSAGVSVICVMLAALIPLLRASRISPMQSIRNVELNRKMKRKKIKTEKEFNVPKLLAKRSIKFYKARQVGVSIILALTIFMSCFGLSVLKTDLKDSAWSAFSASDYRLRTTFYATPAMPGVNYPNMDKRISLNVVQDVLDYPDFTNVRGYKECISYITVDEYSDYMTLIEFAEQNRYLSSTSELTHNDLEGLSFEELCDVWFFGESAYYLEVKEKSKSQQELFQMTMYGYDEQIVEKYENQLEIIDGKIDIDKLNSGEEIILVANEEIGFAVSFGKNDATYDILDLDDEKPDWFYRDNGKIYASQKLDYKAGDTINIRTITSDATEVPESDYMVPGNVTVYDKEVKIGAIVKTFGFNQRDMYSPGNLGVITTTAGLEKVVGASIDYERLFIDYDGELDDDADAAATGYLEALVTGRNFEVESGYAHDKELQSSTKIYIISLLAVVILFFSICASIVNNALTAKIRESKKEIGTLRAVGASVKEITMSYVRQLISMFGWGCGIGFIAYILTHIIAMLINENLGLSFEIWPAIIICVLLYAICSLNLYLKIRKEMKNSIVDNIREL